MLLLTIRSDLPMKGFLPASNSTRIALVVVVNDHRGSFCINYTPQVFVSLLFQLVNCDLRRTEMFATINVFFPLPAK